jgi:hypothetical protein
MRKITIGLLFLFPVLLLILGLTSFSTPGWGDLILTLYLMIAAISALLCLGFLLLAHFRNWELNWWKSLLASAICTGIALAVLVLLAR